MIRLLPVPPPLTLSHLRIGENTDNGMVVVTIAGGAAIVAILIAAVAAAAMPRRAVNQFTEEEDTDWHNDANWSPGHEPDNTEDAVILSHTCVISSDNAVANSVDVESTATLRIESRDLTNSRGSTLTVNGTLASSDAPDLRGRTGVHSRAKPPQPQTARSSASSAAHEPRFLPGKCRSAMPGGGDGGFDAPTPTAAAASRMNISAARERA